MRFGAGAGPRGGKRRAVAGLIGAGVVVLALLSVFAIELTNSQNKSRRDVIARVHERSVLAAALIDSLLQSVDQEQALFEARYGGRAVSTVDLNAAGQQSLYVAVLDRQGRVLAASEGFTAQARRDLPSSGALALVRSGRPYGLGNVLQYGRIGVVDLAVAFSTRYGRRYVVSGLDPSFVSGFLQGELERIPGVAGAHNYVIDGRDTVVASNNPARPAGYQFTNPAVVAALRSSSGDRHGHYYDQTAISDSTWRIVLAEPDGPLFASVSGLQEWLPWLIFAAFAMMAILALLLGGRVLRSAEVELRAANTRLEGVNQQLEVANATLAHDALHDPLTGLPNRALLMDRLNQMLKRSERECSGGCAVLFVDLDRFKLVNDSLSHSVGDELLIEIAARFQQALRPGDTVGRIGGDEFVILLDAVPDERDATAVVERVHGTLSDPINVGAHTLFVRASIGVALRSPGIDAADFVRNADIAMYEAKRRGRGTHVVFDQTMRRRVVDRLGHEHDLRRAIDESLIGVDYQPIIELSSGRISAVEALARWPAGWADVPPTEFVRVAEESGLIGALGQHVLREALQSLASWRAAGLASDEVRVSVNLSPRQLDDPELSQKIFGELASACLPADALRLEITESTLVHTSQHVQRLVEHVCARGVGLHLDDFGTQYSSLTTLQQLPVLALKIDRGFVTSMTRRPDGEAIVRGIIGLAHGLGLSAIAEGIEQPEELERLTALGCDFAQGFLLARPMDRERIEALLKSWSPPELPAFAATLSHA